MYGRQPAKTCDITYRMWQQYGNTAIYGNACCNTNIFGNTNIYGNAYGNTNTATLMVPLTCMVTLIVPETR